MAKRKLLKILIDKADTIKDKIKKLIKGDPAYKYRNDPEYKALTKSLDDINLKLKNQTFEIFEQQGVPKEVLKQERLEGAKYQSKPLRKGSYETMAQKKEKPRAKGGMVKRPQMMQGGAYKGKKHSYAAGGKVNKLNF